VTDEAFLITSGDDRTGSERMFPGLARGEPAIGPTLSADATIAGVTSGSVNVSQDPT
jgi:hypothetical protein